MKTIKFEEIRDATEENPVASGADDYVLQIEQPGDKMTVGEHTFELTVVDDSGNRSEPAKVSVFVIDKLKPTAFLELLDLNNRPVEGNRIPSGSSFRLNGKNSTDAGGGKIKEFIWKLVS